MSLKLLKPQRTFILWVCVLIFNVLKITEILSHENALARIPH